MSTRTGESGFTILETLFVVALIGVIGTIAVPQLNNLIAYFKLSGDARSISNGIAVTKMRAASNFSKTRLYVNTSGRWHKIERADNTVGAPPHWSMEGGVTYMSTNTNFGWGSVSSAPPNTQATIAQAAPCKSDTGADITGTACVVFNSRGVPIAPDTAGVTYTPTPNHAVYVTDGAEVYGVTVASSGMIRVWRTLPTTTPDWALQ